MHGLLVDQTVESSAIRSAHLAPTRASTSSSLDGAQRYKQFAHSLCVVRSRFTILTVTFLEPLGLRPAGSWSAEGRELVIVDLGHATMMPASAW
jgi:hypothetical protein